GGGDDLVVGVERHRGGDLVRFEHAEQHVADQLVHVQAGGVRRVQVGAAGLGDAVAVAGCERAEGSGGGYRAVGVAVVRDEQLLRPGDDALVPGGGEGAQWLVGRGGHLPGVAARGV